jgi:tRNA pseudouridine-54 N-methylase
MLISGSKTFFVCGFQPPFTSIFCLHFFDLKGLDGTCGKNMKIHFIVSAFFKSSKNLEDSSLVILLKPKPIPFSIVSSSGSKVELNFEFNHNNLIAQFVCPNGLPIYVAFVVDF